MKNPRKATDEDKQRGREIAKLRKQKGLTQANVADSLEISTQQYGKYERGEDRMAMSRYLKIVDILGGDEAAQGFAEKPHKRYHAPNERAALRKDIDEIRTMLDKLQAIVERMR